MNVFTRGLILESAQIFIDLNVFNFLTNLRELNKMMNHLHIVNDCNLIEFDFNNMQYAMSCC